MRGHLGETEIGNRRDGFGVAWPVLVWKSRAFDDFSKERRLAFRYRAFEGQGEKVSFLLLSLSELAGFHPSL